MLRVFKFCLTLVIKNSVCSYLSHLCSGNLTIYNINLYILNYTYICVQLITQTIRLSEPC